MRQLVVKKNIRPEIPSWCPEYITTLITKCWDPIARNRPDFASILEEIKCQKHQSKINVDTISEDDGYDLYKFCDISFGSETSKYSESPSHIKPKNFDEISLESSSGIGEMCSNMSTKSFPTTIDKQESHPSDKTVLNEMYTTRFNFSKNNDSHKNNEIIPLPPETKCETVQTPLKSQLSLSSTSHLPFSTTQLVQQKVRLKSVIPNNNKKAKVEENGFTNLLKKVNRYLYVIF